MGINPDLLTKAAKVYEAAESVEGMNPKRVYESHKKCAPGEFNMHKEGYANLQQAIKRAADVTRDPQIENLVRKAPQDTSYGYPKKLMPERSHYADEIARQQNYNDYDDINAFHGLIAKPALKGVGGLVGGRPGRMVGQVVGDGLHMANNAAEYIGRKNDRLDSMIDDMNTVDYQNKIHGIRNPAKPAAPVPQLPVGKPSAPTASPPRGTGMGALRKAGADIKRAAGPTMGSQLAARGDRVVAPSATGSRTPFVEPFRGEASAHSAPLESFRDLGPDLKGFSEYINPQQAPARAPERKVAPLPAGHAGEHPQARASRAFINARNPGWPGNTTSTQSPGNVPYPIRGAGRMGSIPALSPADMIGPVRASMGKAGAFSFGQYVKQALTPVDVAHAIQFGPGPAVFTPGRAAGMGAGAGGLAGGSLGAVLGGLYGAYEPGEESTYDEKGNVSGRKRRGRLHGALRGLAGGGLLGGAAGAGIGGAGGYVNADLLEQARKRVQLENLQNAR